MKTDATELELLAPVQGGRMLARRDGQVVFVHGGVPGETVGVGALVQHRGYLETEATDLLRPSPIRVSPPCPYFGENSRQRGSIDQPTEAGSVCGGCQYQHIGYEAQVALKADVLRDVLRRVGKILDAPVAAPIPSPSPYAYRNKATWLITEDGELAYHEARSHRPVPIASCHLLTPPVHAILEAAHAVSAEIGMAGLARGLEARVLPDPKGAEIGTLLLELAGSTTVQEAQVLAEALAESCPGVRAVVGRTEGALHGHEPEPRVLVGELRTDVAFLGETYRLSPTSFFQVNLPVAEQMARYVLAQCGTLAGKQALDVYSGVGAFSVPMARQADAVISIEIDAGAVADARDTIALAGLDNVTILEGEAGTSLRALLPGTIACAVIDPPRSGCSPDVLRQLARIKAPRLVYVSCDAATLARDLRVLLDHGYKIEAVQPFDLFPQTAHIESVTTLRLPKKYRARR